MKSEKTKAKAAGKFLREEIYQSNLLIQARKDFDIIGTRIFFLGLSGLNPHFSKRDKYFDKDFEQLFVPTKKLTELFGGNTKYLIDIRKACTKLRDATIELKATGKNPIIKKDSITLTNMFEELEYKSREGLYLRFSQNMRPYLLDLLEAKKGYTRLEMKYLFKLTSPYAVRLFELLLQYQNLKQFKEMLEVRKRFTMEELRFALNVPASAYVGRLDNFKSRVLKTAINEIKNRTPYIVSYKTIKQGRNVVAFEFSMDISNVPMKSLKGFKPTFINDAIELLRSLGFNARSAEDIFRKCKNTTDCFLRVNRAVTLLKRYTNKGKEIKSELGFLRKAIEGNWQLKGEGHSKVPKEVMDKLGKKDPKQKKLKGKQSDANDNSRKDSRKDSRNDSRNDYYNDSYNDSRTVRTDDYSNDYSERRPVDSEQPADIGGFTHISFILPGSLKKAVLAQQEKDKADGVDPKKTAEVITNAIQEVRERRLAASQEQEEPPATPRYFELKNGKKMPFQVARDMKKHILQGSAKSGVQSYLDYFEITAEEFLEQAKDVPNDMPPDYVPPPPEEEEPPPPPEPVDLRKPINVNGRKMPFACAQSYKEAIIRRTHSTKVQLMLSVYKLTKKEFMDLVADLPTDLPEDFTQNAYELADSLFGDNDSKYPLKEVTIDFWGEKVELSIAEMYKKDLVEKHPTMLPGDSFIEYHKKTKKEFLAICKKNGL